MARASSPANAGAAAADDRAPGYDAFISYSQRGDKAVARALRTVIQTIGKPWWKVRSLNVFLDATSLSAAPSLWQGIEEKLDRSRYLILLASREAAESKWVDKEVSHFIATKGIDQLLIALTDGDLAWNDEARDFGPSEALPLPPCLRGRFAEEPLWVDLRAFRADPSSATGKNQAFLHAALDLAATIRGVEKADLYSEEVRRQRRSLRLAYGVAVVVAALGVGAGIAAWFAVRNEERATAEAERAVRNFEIAKGTVDDVVFDIAQGLREIEGMRIENVHTILTRVEEAVSRLSDAAADDTDIMRSRGAMLGEFGDTYLAAGDRTRAMESYSQALAIARDLAATDPGNTLWQDDIWVDLSKIGDIELERENLDAARKAFEEALATVSRLRAIDPEKTSWWRGEALMHGRIGRVRFATNDFAGTLEAEEQSLGLHRALSATDPENTLWQRDIATVLEVIAAAKEETGDLPGATAALTESVGIGRKLHEDDPGNALRWRDVALRLLRLGDLDVKLGHTAAALAAWQESVDIARHLTSIDPENAVWLHDLSVGLDRVAGVRLTTGNARAAVDGYQESLDILRKLAALDPQDPDLQQEVAGALGRVGDARLALGDLAGALAAYEEQAALTAGLLERWPGDTDLQDILLVAWIKAGDARSQTGDSARALSAYEEALKAAHALLKVAPDHILWRNNAAEALERIGGLKRDTDEAGAVAAYEEALVLRRSLAATEPDQPERHRAIVANLEQLGYLKARSGDGNGAVAAMEEMVAAGRDLVRLLPDSEEEAIQLAGNLDRLANLKMAMNDPPGALAAWREKLDLVRALFVARPDDAARRRNLADAWADVAWGGLFTGDLADSEAASREAIALEPGETAFLVKLAHVLMLTGRIEAADAIYLGQRGTMLGDRRWEEVVLDDFHALRSKNVDHPHMAEIERIFASPDPVPAEPAAAE